MSIQVRLLGSSATVRRESVRTSSVLDKDMRQFLRDQPLCQPKLFGSKCGEALKVASADRQKQFILKAALGGPFQLLPLPAPQGSQRFVQRREKGRTSTLQNLQGIDGCLNLVSHLGDQAGEADYRDGGVR